MRLAFLLALFVLTGCQKVEAWRKPELAACDSFIQSGLKSPSSYKRVDYTVIDQPVSPTVLNKAVGLIGNAQMQREIAAHFVKPTVRSVLINYDADNAFGASLRGIGSCQFAISDGKEVFRTPQAAADAAISHNQVLELVSSPKGEQSQSTNCCLDQKFNMDDLNAEESKGGSSVYDKGTS